MLSPVQYSGGLSPVRNLEISELCCHRDSPVNSTSNTSYRKTVSINGASTGSDRVNR